MSAENGFVLEGNQLTLYLYVQPRASKVSWGRVFDNKIKLSLTAAPKGRQANKQRISFLAKALKVPHSNISIQHGVNNRNKVVRVDNINSACWENVIQQIKIFH